MKLLEILLAFITTLGLTVFYNWSFKEALITFFAFLAILFIFDKIGFMRTKDITAPIQVVFTDDIVTFVDFNNTKNNLNVLRHIFMITGNGKKLIHTLKQQTFTDMAYVFVFDNARFKAEFPFLRNATIAELEEYGLTTKYNQPEDIYN